MESKPSFVFFPADFLAAVHNFRKNQIADLIIALSEHNLYGKISTPLSEKIKDRFFTLQKRIDENNQKYYETLEKRKVGGIKGGRPKKEKNNLKVLNGDKNAPVCEPCSESDDDNESDNENIFIKNKNNESVSVEKNGVQPNAEGAPSVSDIVKYCKMSGANIDPVKFVEFYNARQWKAGKEYVPNKWQRYVDDWDARNRGLQPTSSELQPIGNCLARVLSRTEVQS